MYPVKDVPYGDLINIARPDSSQTLALYKSCTYLLTLITFG